MGSNMSLVRTSDGMIAGVCAGIAHRYGWSVGGTRLVYVLVSILSAAFPGILVYLLLWLIIPKGPRPD